MPQAQSKFFKEALLIFLAALAVRLWFNFACDHVNAFASADASEYLRYAAAISKIDWQHPDFSGPFQEFIITGPSFPFFLAFASAPIGFDSNNSAYPLFLQSVLSALTAALTALSARKLFDERCAWLAGTFAVLYPGFIVNTGRLYSETFATFIEVAALYATILFLSKSSNDKAPSKKVYLLAALAGALSVIAQLTRSAMLLFTLTVMGAIFFYPLYLIARAKVADLSANKQAGSLKAAFKQSLFGLLSFGFGCLLMLAPWFTLEKAAFNKISFTVDRVGNYNLFIGTNTESQGFLSYPYPDGSKITEKSFATLVKEAFKKSPSRFLRLILDKPARLYKFPWNDYRVSIGPFSVFEQIAFHQVIILLSIIGLALGFCTLNQLPEISSGEISNTVEDGAEAVQSQSLFYTKVFTLLVLAGNLPYLAFITVPRYNLTAMPILIIFAAQAVNFLQALLKNHPLERAPRMITLSALFLIIYFRDDLGHLTSGTPVLSFVQGLEPIAKGVIGALATLIMFSGIFLTIKLIDKATRPKDKLGLCSARALSAILLLATLPVVSLQARANGRPGEGILKVSDKAKLTGAIKVADSAVRDRDCYLLIDSDKGELLSSNCQVKAFGKPLKTPFIPGLAALDDWHYLKERNGTAYVECAYIFDCMTQAAGIDNLAIRQWYLLPLPQETIESIKQCNNLPLEIELKDKQPFTLFAAGQAKAKNSTMPSLALYSWEKAFYGVENDEGLTDSRFDEMIAKREAPFRLKLADRTLELNDIDLNVRLLAVERPPLNSPENQPPLTLKATGTKTLKLPIPDDSPLRRSLALLALELSYPENFDVKAHFVPGLSKSHPQLNLTWQNKEGKTVSLALPWTRNPEQQLSIAVPVDLSQIQGENLTLEASFRDDRCRIALSASPLAAHPLFAPHKLY